MKIAITSTSNHPDAFIDSHFGRCSYFVIYDSQTKKQEYILNPFKDKIENSGTDSTNFLAQLKVSKVISGEFGEKVKKIFDTLHIQLVLIKKTDTKITDILHLINNQSNKND